MNRVRENLWIGDFEDALALVQMGTDNPPPQNTPAPFPNMVNLAGYDPLFRYDPPEGVDLLMIEHEDGRMIPSHTIVRFLRWMTARQGPVFIHCFAGISRAPSFAIAWMIHQALLAGDTRTVDELWTVFESEIRATRTYIQPHHQLKQSVLFYFGTAGYDRWRPFSEVSNDQ